MSAIAYEFEYLIARARRSNQLELAEQLARAYNRYLDSVTS